MVNAYNHWRFSLPHATQRPHNDRSDAAMTLTLAGIEIRLMTIHSRSPINLLTPPIHICTEMSSILEQTIKLTSPWYNPY